MKKSFFYLFVLFATGCQQTNNTETQASKTIVVNKAKEIALERKSIKPEPVASYSKPITGQAIQGQFSVKIYETKSTFDYLMKIVYAELKVTDTLTLPNLGELPQPEITAASATNACIVGFYDNKHVFKPYKQVQVKNDKLSIKALKHYAVATYRAN